jgi:hypothetical protein
MDVVCGSSRWSQIEWTGCEFLSTELSPESSLESLEVSFPEWIEIVGIYTVFLDPLPTSGSRYNLGIRYPSISYESPGPCQELASP